MPFHAGTAKKIKKDEAQALLDAAKDKLNELIDNDDRINRLIGLTRAEPDLAPDTQLAFDTFKKVKL